MAARGREYKAACNQWLSKVGGKTTMQEGLQRYQQELWAQGKNPARIGPDSVISECYAGGSKCAAPPAPCPRPWQHSPI